MGMDMLDPFIGFGLDPVKCIYDQAGGGIVCFSGIDEIDDQTAFSGVGSCKNNPACEGVSYRGPIPRQEWQMNLARKGDYCKGTGGNHLTLSPPTAWNGRGHFCMHGGGPDSSEGCIVTKPGLRLWLIRLFPVSTSWTV